VSAELLAQLDDLITHEARIGHESMSREDLDLVAIRAAVVNGDRYSWLREQVRIKDARVAAQALFWNYSSRREFDKAVDRARGKA
jgi:hypothetical protein